MRRAFLSVVSCVALGTVPALAQAPTTAGPEHGALVLVGGGANRPAFVQRFVQLAGGPDASIVVIPTTLEDDRLTPAGLEQIRTRHQEIMGVSDIVVLHTRSRKVASSARFVAPLERATGVWILGGAPEYVQHAYAGTRTESAIKAVLARGGVVGGTSAGALIQASTVIDTLISSSPGSTVVKTVAIGDTYRGFGLLKNAAVFAHWSARNLDPFVGKAMAAQPGLLGIALDEATAVVIQGTRLEVLGDGHVGIYDHKDHGGKAFDDLVQGQRYDLNARAKLPIT